MSKKPKPIPAIMADTKQSPPIWRRVLAFGLPRHGVKIERRDGTTVYIQPDALAARKGK